MNEGTDDQAWREVLEFWFPEGRSLQIDAATIGITGSGGCAVARTARSPPAFRNSRQGRPQEISTTGLPIAEGRLALIIVLDQFSRSVWRGSPRAFAQDPAALALAMEGLSNGHYAALPTPWYKVLFGMRIAVRVLVSSCFTSWRRSPRACSTPRSSGWRRAVWPDGAHRDAGSASAELAVTVRRLHDATVRDGGY